MNQKKSSLVYAAPLLIVFFFMLIPVYGDNSIKVAVFKNVMISIIFLGASIWGSVLLFKNRKEENKSSQRIKEITAVIIFAIFSIPYLIHGFNCIKDLSEEPVTVDLVNCNVVRNSKRNIAIDKRIKGENKGQVYKFNVTGIEPGTWEELKAGDSIVKVTYYPNSKTVVKVDVSVSKFDLYRSLNTNM